MEQLYNPIDYNSSEHIQIKDYFSVFKSSLVENGMFKVIPKSNEYPRNEFTEAFEIAGMDFTETQKDCLAKVCRFVYSFNYWLFYAPIELYFLFLVFRI